MGASFGRKALLASTWLRKSGGMGLYLHLNSRSIGMPLWFLLLNPRLP